MNVCNLKQGEKGIVVSIDGDAKLKKRLLALGCIEGTKVEYKICAPLGDPMIINFRGFNLAIRKNDAKNISIRTKEN